jgi:ABC-type oligopeptide transport system ATPase subunit
VKVPHGYRIEQLLIDFNTVEGKRYIRINVSEKTRKAFSAVIKVDRKTVSNRIARLIAGDISVIDEVEEIDQRLIREITDQLRASIVKRMIEDERKEREIEEREREKEELNNILVGD